MRICKIIIYVSAVSVLFTSLSGCAKKEDRSKEEADANAESNSQSLADDEEGLQRQVDEVRRAFLSLQQVCEANDVDGYLAFWDDETKIAVDGRDLDVDERRERRRQSLTKKPGMLEEIANAKIASITVDTSQAEKIRITFGVEIEGAMMLVRTDGDAFLFHETADGWKLFTRASPGYFP